MAKNAGFTLFETLVAMAIAAILAATMAGLSRTISPSAQLRASVEQLAGDLERARIEARRSGRPVTVMLNETGYQIDALQASGTWGQAEMRVEDGATRLVFQPGAFGHPQTAITLSLDDLEATVQPGPVTGRIDVQIKDAR